MSIYTISLSFFLIMHISFQNILGMDSYLNISYYNNITNNRLTSLMLAALICVFYGQRVQNLHIKERFCFYLLSNVSPSKLLNRQLCLLPASR
jgi:hypothetical protein